MFATHWYGDDIDGQGFKDLQEQDKITKFADSLAAYFETQAGKTVTVNVGNKEVQVSARLDGYDVDVECAGGNRYGDYGTKVPWLVDVMAGVRSKLDAVKTTPKFYVSITPAWNDDLDKVVNGQSLAHYVDYLNMQRYSGGDNPDGTPEAYLKAIDKLKPEQLTYGISTEWTPNCAEKTFDGVMEAYGKEIDHGHYGGLWTWRLNSGNGVFTNAAQVELYNQIHPSEKLPNAPNLDRLKEVWQNSGHDLKSTDTI